jgi:prefoldin subunit 5
MRGLDSTITGMVGVATNITERVMAEEALTEAYQNLDKQNKQLERVQELFRSTLDQVSDTVRRGAVQAELTEYIEFVQTQFDRLD